MHFPMLWTLRGISIIFTGVQNHEVYTLTHQISGARLGFVSASVARPTC